MVNLDYIRLEKSCETYYNGLDSSSKVNSISSKVYNYIFSLDELAIQDKAIQSTSELMNLKNELWARIKIYSSSNSHFRSNEFQTKYWNDKKSQGTDCSTWKK